MWDFKLASSPFSATESKMAVEKPAFLLFLILFPVTVMAKQPARPEGKILKLDM